jgi:Leucine Rich repeat
MTPMTRCGIRFFASLPALLLVVLLAGCGNGGPPQTLTDAAGPKEGEEPSAGVAAAWLAAGSNYGGMRLGDRGEMLHMPYSPPGAADRGPGPRENELPSFHFREPPRGQLLASLPTAEVPFALAIEKAKDADLKGLAKLKSLRMFGLWQSAVTDAGLKEVAGLARLRSFEVRSKEVTDAGLRHLARLEGLTSIALGDCPKITDAGLKDLAGLTQLESLSLRGTGVTDEGLKQLKTFERLRLLDLSATKVTDAGLKHLAALKQLRSLYLSHDGVKGPGLKDLAGLDKLETLYLFDTPLTDEGLRHLAGMKQLKLLHLNLTQVTREGVAQLQKSLPKLEIKTPW